MDLIDTFRTCRPNAEEYTFFSSARGTFFRIGCILSYKSNLSKFKKIEIVIKHLLWAHPYETRYQLQEKNCKKHIHLETNTFLNNQQVTEEIKREIKKFLQTNENENMTTQNLWDAAKVVLRGKFIAIQSYLTKQEKTSNRQPSFMPKTTGKRRTNKSPN